MGTSEHGVRCKCGCRSKEEIARFDIPRVARNCFSMVLQLSAGCVRPFQISDSN